MLLFKQLNSVLLSITLYSLNSRLPSLVPSRQTVQLMAHHLSSPDPDVRARSVGCLHNLSADAVSLSLLREAGCLSPVVALLRDPSPELCRAAAGIVQNTVSKSTLASLLCHITVTAITLTK